MPEFIRKSSFEKLAYTPEKTAEIDKEAFLNRKSRLEKVVDKISAYVRKNDVSIAVKLSEVVINNEKRSTCELTFPEVHNPTIAEKKQAFKILLDQKSDNDDVYFDYIYNQDYYNEIHLNLPLSMPMDTLEKEWMNLADDLLDAVNQFHAFIDKHDVFITYEDLVKYKR